MRDKEIKCFDCHATMPSWEEAKAAGWDRWDFPGWLHYYCPDHGATGVDEYAPRLAIVRTESGSLTCELVEKRG